MVFRLTPEAQARAAQCKEWADNEARRFASMTDANLLLTIEVYEHHAEPRRWAPGEPVYDATLWQIILPELKRRLRNGSNT